MQHAQTPLYLCVKATESSATMDVAGQLLRADADPNCKNKQGRAPLHEAASKGSEGLVDALLRFGANAVISDKVRHPHPPAHCTRAPRQIADTLTPCSARCVCRLRGAQSQGLTLACDLVNHPVTAEGPVAC